MSSQSIIPVIDISSLLNNDKDKYETANLISKACEEVGFFYISNHGIDESLQNKLELLIRQFFALPVEEKNKIDINLNGKVGNGYMSKGYKKTDGQIEVHEGLHFTEETPEDHPLAKAGVMFYSPNKYPDISGFRETLLQYLAAMKPLAQKLLEGMAISLGLNEEYFNDLCIKEGRLRILLNYYPKIGGINDEYKDNVGRGAHSDGSVLTILKQDSYGGLEIKHKSGWIKAAPIQGTFICNIGDMLHRMTGGLYRSTIHRVIRPVNSDRISYPIFISPHVLTVIKPIEELVGDKGFIEDTDCCFDKSAAHDVNNNFIDYMICKHKKTSKFIQEIYGNK